MKDFQYLMKLKEVYRDIPLTDRWESDAEHTWGCLVLADNFLQYYPGIDRLKVYDLLLYHDLIEIEAGDAPLTNRPVQKSEIERTYVPAIEKQVPACLQERFALLYNEFNEERTLEAKFAKAIDAMEPNIQLLEQKVFFKERKITRQWCEQMKRHHFEPFPELLSLWEEILAHWGNGNFFQ